MSATESSGRKGTQPAGRRQQPRLITSILGDPTTPDAVRDWLGSALKLDPVDAASDAALLAELLATLSDPAAAAWILPTLKAALSLPISEAAHHAKDVAEALHPAGAALAAIRTNSSAANAN